jgi:hypothetical protein
MIWCGSVVVRYTAFWRIRAEATVLFYWHEKARGDRRGSAGLHLTGKCLLQMLLFESYVPAWQIFRKESSRRDRRCWWMFASSSISPRMETDGPRVVHWC